MSNSSQPLTYSAIWNNMSDTITISSADTIYTGGAIGDNTVSITSSLLGAGHTGSINIGAGSTYTTTNWQSTNAVFNGGNNSPVMTIPPGENTVQIEPGATLDVKGKVVINGIELEERLRTIETLLQIPTRDATIELKHTKLKQLYEQYMHELEKYKTWNRLTGDTDAT